MNRRTAHMTLTGVGLALLLALTAPAVAHAMSSADGGQEAVVQYAVSPGGQAVEQQAVTATGQGGFGWPEAAIGAGIAIGIVFLGLWGDAAVGAVIAGVAALVGAACGRRMSRPRRGFAWPEAAIGAVNVIGIVLLGLSGDAVVGAVITGVAALTLLPLEIFRD